MHTSMWFMFMHPAQMHEMLK